MKSFLRSSRVAEAIKEELADLLLRSVKDPRVAGVVLSAVEVTPDLHHARVFWDVHEDAARAGAQAGLDHAAGFLRHELRGRMRMRYTPELKFVLDESFDRAARIEALLKEEKA